MGCAQAKHGQTKLRFYQYLEAYTLPKAFENFKRIDQSLSQLAKNPTNMYTS